MRRWVAAVTGGRYEWSWAGCWCAWQLHARSRAHFAALLDSCGRQAQRAHAGLLAALSCCMLRPPPTENPITHTLRRSCCATRMRCACGCATWTPASLPAPASATCCLSARWPPCPAPTRCALGQLCCSGCVLEADGMPGSCCLPTNLLQLQLLAFVIACSLEFVCKLVCHHRCFCCCCCSRS